MIWVLLLLAGELVGSDSHRIPICMEPSGFDMRIGQYRDEMVQLAKKLHLSRLPGKVILIDKWVPGRYPAIEHVKEVDAWSTRPCGPNDLVTWGIFQ
jgi:hypothetical protein